MKPVSHVYNQPDRPTMLFDGDCGFCRAWIDRWRQITGRQVDYHPYQEVLSEYTPLTEDACRQAVQLVDTEGRVYAGAHGVMKSLSTRRAYAWLLHVYEKLPLMRQGCDRAYRFVAHHRGGLSWLTRFFYGTSAARSRYSTALHLYRVGLALVYLAAFASAAAQIKGLMGSSGVIPVAEWTAQVQAADVPWWRVPSVLLLNSSDGMLLLVLASGMAAAIALMAGVMPAVSAAVCWLAYLSIVSAGQPFFAFQWDALLLETGFLAMWLFPFQWRVRWRESSGATPCLVFLHHVLLFKLLFSSGAVKLLSGDESWRNLTAMSYHYWTQPLPSMMAWYIDKLPAALHQWTCAAVLVLELLVPFCFFMPRRPRHVAALLHIGLQLLIILTGSYTFFNLLTICLCLLLLDDRWWKRSYVNPSEAVSISPVRKTLVMPLCAVFVVLHVCVLSSTLRLSWSWPKAVQTTYRSLAGFRVMNSYGLFAVMTKSRPELIIQGSMDGRQWRDYIFAYKPGPLSQPPRYAAPHQPRLDWQCWFAALSHIERQPWLYALAGRLLAGDQTVEQLFKKVPFADSPPRYIRIVRWQYRFTSWRERSETGQWWMRSQPELYMPALRQRHTSAG